MPRVAIRKPTTTRLRTVTARSGTNDPGRRADLRPTESVTPRPATERVVTTRVRRWRGAAIRRLCLCPRRNCSRPERVRTRDTRFVLKRRSVPPARCGASRKLTVTSAAGANRCVLVSPRAAAAAGSTSSATAALVATQAFVRGDPICMGRMNSLTFAGARHASADYTSDEPRCHPALGRDRRTANAYRLTTRRMCSVRAIATERTYSGCDP
jgi:hypothetical protein